MPSGVYKRKPGKRKLLDLTEKRFGRLVALKVDHRKGDNRKSSVTYWRCRCDCGNEHVATVACLRNGSVQSCGCLRRELASKKGILRARPIGPVLDLRRQGFTFAAIGRLLKRNPSTVANQYYSFLRRTRRTKDGSIPAVRG